MNESDDTDALLAEQVAYYRAIAGEYGRHSIPGGGADELFAAFDAFRPTGRVLELACGTGEWTERLLRHATSITAVDASPEMIAHAQERIGNDPRVSFVQGDLFDFHPRERHDVVFFGFFLSHVPLPRFADFWAMVAEGLLPTGRVFFVDDSYRPPEELIEGASSATVERRLLDGTAFRAVKVPHHPEDLQARLERLGWEASVHATPGPFYWGEAKRRG